MTQLISICIVKTSCKEAINCQWKLEQMQTQWQRIDQFKQRLSLCHIGLTNEHGGYLINKPCLKIIDKCQKATGDNIVSIIRKINTEHGK